jgi:hypothetical protein
MWLCLNNAFLSVVHKDCAADELLVRARVAGHIEAVFPHAKVTESTNTDYRYRAVVKRELVKGALMNVVDGIQYDNFKNSVKSRRLHDAFAAIWSVMARMQPTAPYSGRRQAQGSLVD